MSEQDGIIQDFNWDDENNVVNEPAGGGAFVHFGWLKFVPLQVSKSFTAGDYVTVPGVEGGNFDQKDENGLKKFGGWKLGGNRRLFVLVGTKLNKEGEKYQVIKQYKNQTDGNDEPHLWRDYVMPAFQKLSKEDRAKVLAGCPAKWEEVGTGIKGTFKDRDTGEDKEFEHRVWANFEVYPSDEAMLEASEKHFANINGNGTAAAFQYPDHWKGNEADMNEWLKGELSKEGADVAEVAKQAGLSADATPDYKKILAVALGVPEPMVNL